MIFTLKLTKLTLFHHFKHKRGLVYIENNYFVQFMEEISTIIEKFPQSWVPWFPHFSMSDQCLNSLSPVVKSVSKLLQTCQKCFKVVCIKVNTATVLPYKRWQRKKQTQNCVVDNNSPKIKTESSCSTG